MVDGINANWEKWQELCFSSQRTPLRASVSNQSTDPVESSDEAETTKQSETTEKVNRVKNTKFGSKPECSEVLRFRANKESDGGTTSAGEK